MRYFLSLLLTFHFYLSCKSIPDIEYVSDDIDGEAKLDERPFLEKVDSPESEPLNDFKFYCNNEDDLEPSLHKLLVSLIPSSIPNLPFHPSLVKAAENLVEIEIPAVINDIYSFAKTTLATPSDEKTSNDNANPLIEVHNNMLGAVGNLTEASLSAVMNARLPFHLMFKDGVFHIERNKLSMFSATEDVHLFQQSHVSVGYMCRTAFSYESIRPYAENACGLFSSHQPVSHDKSDSSMWYRIDNICSSQSAAVCVYKVDPFRRSCIAYKSASVKSIKYSTLTPLIKDSFVWSFLSTILAYLTKFTSLLQPLDSTLKAHPKIAKFIDAALLETSSWLPTYLTSGLFGIVLLSSAESLAESTMFQYCIAAVGGFMLAFVWVAYVLCTTTNTLLNRAIPTYQKYISPLAQIVFGGTAYYHFLFSSQWLTSMLFDMIAKFWNDGAFGLPWTGKAFFISSMIASILITRYFGLFQSKTQSSWMLIFIIRTLGALFLFNGTSNGEISVAFVVLGMFQESIAYLAWRLEMEIVVRTAPKNFVKKISAKQLDEIKTSTTQRELKKLQQYLMNNPDKTDLLHDKLFEGNRKQTASNLYRFVQGDLSVGLSGWGSRGGNYDEVDDEQDDFDEYDPSTGGSPASRFRSHVASKSPATQRRIVRKRSSSLFRFLFPVLFFAAITVGVGLLVLKFQNRLW